MTHDKKWLSLAIGLTFLTLDLVTQPSLSQGGLHFLILSFFILSQDHFQPVLSFFILNQNDMSFCHHAPVFFIFGLNVSFAGHLGPRDGTLWLRHCRFDAQRSWLWPT
jgi:hypothetical protein